MKTCKEATLLWNNGEKEEKKTTSTFAVKEACLAYSSFLSFRHSSIVGYSSCMFSIVTKSSIFSHANCQGLSNLSESMTSSLAQKWDSKVVLTKHIHTLTHDTIIMHSCS